MWTLEDLAPERYHLRHDILALLHTGYSWKNKVAHSLEGLPWPTSKEISNKLQKPLADVEREIAVLLSRDEISVYRQQGQRWICEKKGEAALSDRTHLKEGRDDAYKTFIVYGARVAMVAAIISIGATIGSFLVTNNLKGKVEELKAEVSRLEARIETPTPKQNDEHEAEPKPTASPGATKDTTP